MAVTVPMMHTLVEAGDDIIELGVPFSDPMADGPTIQRASERALLKKVSLRQVIAAVAEFRTRDSKTPVVLMGYANPIEAMGVDAFASATSTAGADGVLVVDYPPEESKEFAQVVRAAGLDVIFLLAPTSTDTRIRAVGEIGSGYIYYVSLKGVTGAGHIDIGAVSQRIPFIRESVGLPVAKFLRERRAKTFCDEAHFRGSGDRVRLEIAARHLRQRFDHVVRNRRSRRLFQVERDERLGVHDVRIFTIDEKFKAEPVRQDTQPHRRKGRKVCAQLPPVGSKIGSDLLAFNRDNRLA